MPARNLVGIVAGITFDNGFAGWILKGARKALNIGTGEAARRFTMNDFYTIWGFCNKLGQDVFRSIG